MAASPAFLAAIKAGMAPPPQDPVDYNGIDITPGADTMPAPLAVSNAPPSNDPLARLEADPNGRIAPMTQAQALGINRGAIAPRQAEAIPTGKMVPVFNAAGQQIGEEPETRGGGLFQNPLSHGPVSFNATTGKPVESTAKKEAKPEGAVDPSTLHFHEPTAAQKAEGEASTMPMPTGARAAGFRPDPGIDKAFNEKKAAVAGVAQAEQRAIEDEGVGHALMGQTISQQAEEARRRAIDINTAAQQREKEIEDQAKIVSSMKIDPDRRWHGAGVANNIALLIAAAFSGFAAGYNRQSGNVALEMAQRATENDIDAQKFNIESAKGKIGEMKGMLADFYKRTGNMDQAVALANAKALDAQIEQTNSYAAQSRSAISEAKARDMTADMDMQRAQWLAKAQAAAAGNGNGLAKQIATLTQENMKAGDDEHTARARAIHVATGTEGGLPTFGGKGGKDGTMVNLPGGGTGQAITKEGADDFRQRSLGADKFQRAVSEMQAIRDTAGGGAFSPSAMARYEGLAAEAKTAYVQMNGFKRTPNETEFHALDKIIPPEISMFGVKNISTDDVLKQASQLADDARKDAAGQYLVQDPNRPVQPSQDEAKKLAGFAPRGK